jgi:hypothetical protein
MARATEILVVKQRASRRGRSYCFIWYRQNDLQPQANYFIGALILHAYEMVGEADLFIHML